MTRDPKYLFRSTTLCPLCGQTVHRLDMGRIAVAQRAKCNHVVAWMPVRSSDGAPARQEDF